MYVPHFNRIEDEEQIASFVTEVAVGTLITVGPDGLPDATLLPILWRSGVVIAHLAKANEHGRRIVDGSPGLVVVQGPDAYVTPSWYPAKSEHGRMVPTWNYSLVQLRGRVRVHQDPEWLRAAVTELTDRHEQQRAEPWRVTDAPERYVHGQLRAIVGVELTVEHADAKAKWSQNRSAADREGVTDGYLTEGNQPAADRVRDGRL